MNLHKIVLDSKIQLEKGGQLPGLEVAYHTSGKLNSDASNVIWVCHALTANSNPAEWWEGLFGANAPYASDDYFVVCVNMLGSPYGTTSPLDVNPETGESYFHSFPEFTNRDVVQVFELVRQHLQINKIHTLIGGSLGGQQALEWTIINPEVTDQLILVATNAKHSPWGIAFNESQRLAIQADQTWVENQPEAGKQGLKAARSMALLSYRNHEAYNSTQEDENEDLSRLFKAQTYQQYQGEKLINRFNAYSYYRLTQAMDTHNVGRNRGGVKTALSQVNVETLVVSMEGDLLFPPEEQLFLAKYIPNARWYEVKTKFGHDGFLIETPQLVELFKEFIKPVQEITPVG